MIYDWVYFEFVLLGSGYEVLDGVELFNCCFYVIMVCDGMLILGYFIMFVGDGFFLIVIMLYGGFVSWDYGGFDVMVYFFVLCGYVVY